MAQESVIIEVLRIMWPLYGNTAQKDMSIVPGWKIALMDVPDQEVIEALPKVLKSCKFFPSPAEYLSYLPGRSENSSMQKFEKLCETVRKCGPYTKPILDNDAKAFVKNKGGWKEFCKLTTEQLIWAKKEFVSSIATDTLHIEHNILQIEERETVDIPMEVDLEVVRQKLNELIEATKSEKKQPPPSIEESEEIYDVHDWRAGHDPE